MDEKLQIRILEQQIRDLKNKLFEKDFLSSFPRGDYRFQSRLNNKILEIFSFGGDDTGWVIRCEPGGSFRLFDVGTNENFEGEFDNIYDALKIAITWT